MCETVVRASDERHAQRRKREPWGDEDLDDDDADDDEHSGRTSIKRSFLRKVLLHSFNEQIKPINMHTLLSNIVALCFFCPF